MKRALLILMCAFAISFLLFILGPRAHYDSEVPLQIESMATEELDFIIRKKENEIKDLKPGNGAKIVWSDTLHKKTEYSVVYLHGFSSSHEEGMPVHREFAKRYGCNLYLSRLAEHGREDIDAFKELTPQKMLESSRFALEVGKSLGEKVILMCCSTGSTTGIVLAGEDPDVAATFHYSPNIDIAGDMDAMLVGPWGRQFARFSFGGDYRTVDYSEEKSKYWNNKYHLNGLIALKYLLDETMTRETFAKITQPLFMAYYYKNEQEQDPVVSVKRMLNFYDQISTPDRQKRKVQIENGRHVMTSHFSPSEAMEIIQTESYLFAEEVLGMQPVELQTND